MGLGPGVRVKCVLWFVAWGRQRSRNYKDCTVHLGGSRNHVLNIICVSRSINVRIMPFFRFVFDMSNINSNASGFFFRGVINIFVFFGCG